jgi:hypothetical protein
MTVKAVRGFYQEHNQHGQRHIDLSSSSVELVLRVRVDLHKLRESHLVGVPGTVALHLLLDNHQPNSCKGHTRAI